MNYKKGFTLLEMSMVLVVIALIFSLITYAGSLIKQSQAKSLIAELSQFQQMIQTFTTQYAALPGDFANAYNTFGSSCSTIASECNGNSNGIIEWNNSTTNIESLRAWQHLNLAGLLSIGFPGTTSTSGESDIGVNIPASSWPGAGVELYVGAATQNGATGNAIQIAGFTASSSANSANIMTPQDAWSIDMKIDDGIGQKGRILGFNTGTTTSCVGTDNLTYNLNVIQNICYIRYLLYPAFNN